MSKPMNIHAAKTQFSRLVEKAAAGEEIIIAKAGKPMAKLGPVNPPPKKKKKGRQPGILAGKMKIPANFDAPLPDEILDLFDKSPLFPAEKR
ncbi:MAG: type II toxin-antitoxin system Phd/YefM family antitoxin [Alphaproteobacteria bacterium]|nr:type II toxin-antitoxin system Phd/YefM family antitoxin [Alphaproteobacteria bacterium]